VSFLISALERALPGLLGQRVVAVLRHQGTAGTATRGSLVALFVSVGGVFISFAVQVSLTRALGPTEYGTYAVVLVWMYVVLLFTKIELDIVTTRFVGAYTASEDWPRLHGLLRSVPRHVLLRTVIAASIGAVVLLAMRGSRFDHFIPAALMAAVLMVLTAQIIVRGAALQGFKRVLPAQLPNVLVRPALFLGVIWATIAAGVRFGAATAIAFNALATFIAILVADRYLRRATPDAVRNAAPVNEAKEWRRVGYGLVFISAAQLSLSQSSDLVLVAALINRTASAYYSVASQLALLVSFASTAVMFIVAPLISELFSKQQLDTLRRFTRATTTVCLAVSLLFLLGIVIFGRLLLGLYGDAFRVAYLPLLVLAMSHFVTASVGSLAGWLMTMTGHERPAAWMIGGSAILNIALSIPLTIAYGILGTATATLISTLVRSLMLSVFLRRRLGILLVPAPPAALRA
jgi:O-antigen/teichoic acid export membrane protein